jgi:hypothetical protein
MHISKIPQTISHDTLLAALECRSLDEFPEDTALSVYRMQLRHSLLSLARRAHLALTAHELTGLPESELAQKSTVELMVMLDRQRTNARQSEVARLRHWFHS